MLSLVMVKNNKQINRKDSNKAGSVYPWHVAMPSQAVIFTLFVRVDIWALVSAWMGLFQVLQEAHLRHLSQWCL